MSPEDWNHFRLKTYARTHAIPLNRETLFQTPPAREEAKVVIADQRVGRPPVLSRKQAAGQAHLSEHQRETALRVASIPEPEFELAIESVIRRFVTGSVRRSRYVCLSHS